MSLRALRQELLERTDLHGDAFCHALSQATDGWLAGLLDHATGGDLNGLALMAVGGYGRGELCPGSDLDVVLVHERRRDVGAMADAVWYPVWDEGVRLDHSVRRPAEVLEVAAEDLRAQLGLLDGRLVAGDASVVSPLLARALDLWRSRAGHWLPVLAEQVDERHRTQGDVAFLLEPDLKESHGGLRDIHVVVAAAPAVPAVADEVDLSSLDGPRQVLTAAHVELHRNTGRATDRLLLQEQDQVAAALDYVDADDLMGAISEAGRTVAWVADDVWRRRALWTTSRGGRRLRRPGRRGSGQGRPAVDPRSVEPGVALAGDSDVPHDGQTVVLGPDAAVDTDVGLPLRVAAVAAERQLPIARATLDILAEHSPPPPTPWPDDVRDALVRVLAAGAPAITALEALDQRGLLTRLIPEWAAVRNRPQRNAFHRFTVDRHLLEAAAEAASLSRSVSRPDLLLVGALLHDIGKGFPGDHTDVGVELVGDMGRRLGFGPDDVDVLVSLVRNHLLLSELATRRDLDDPATVDAVVRAVGDRTRLELLAALTEADSRATGPAAWGSWKAGLVADLVRRSDAAPGRRGQTGAGLSRHRPPPRLHGPGPEARTIDRGGQRADGHGGRQGPVRPPGRRRRRLRPPRSERPFRRCHRRRGLRRRVVRRRALPTPVAGLGARRRRDRRRPPRHPSPRRATGQAGPRLCRRASPVLAPTHRHGGHGDRRRLRDVDGDRDPRPDSVGLLYRITSALFALDLDVVAARVTTNGSEVVDAFYVGDRSSGGKITDPSRIAAIEDGARDAITTDARSR